MDKISAEEVDEIAKALRCADDNNWSRGEIIRFAIDYFVFMREILSIDISNMMDRFGKKITKK